MVKVAWWGFVPLVARLFLQDEAGYVGAECGDGAYRLHGSEPLEYQRVELSIERCGDGGARAASGYEAGAVTMGCQDIAAFSGPAVEPVAPVLALAWRPEILARLDRRLPPYSRPSSGCA